MLIVVNGKMRFMVKHINIADICWGLEQANIRMQFEDKAVSVQPEEIEFLASKIMSLYDWNNHSLMLNHRRVLRKIPFLIREHYLLQPSSRKISKIDFANYFDEDPAANVPFVGMTLLGDTILCEKGLLRKKGKYHDSKLSDIAKNAYLAGLARLFKAKSNGGLDISKETSIVDINSDVSRRLFERISNLTYDRLTAEYKQSFEKFDNYINLLQKYVDIGMPAKRENQSSYSKADWKSSSKNDISTRTIDNGCKSSCASCSSGCIQPKKKENECATENVKLQEGIDLNNPLGLIAELDKYIVGQDEAKKTLSIAVSDQYVRQSLHGKVGTELMKPNVLLIGPSGCGKTYMLEILSQISDIPLYKMTLTGMSAAGYVNESINTLLEPYAKMMKTDPAKYSYGIIFLDEFDKIATHSTDKDIFTKKLQQILIKLMDKNTVEGVDSTNLMFVAAGAFSGIEDIVRSRLCKKEKGIGFGADLRTSQNMDKYSRRELFDSINVDDLSSYGLMPELIGRIGMNISLHPLSKQSLIDIMINSKGSIIHDQKIMFEQGYGLRLEFEQGAYETIAEYAQVSMTGARSLMPSCIKVLQDYKLNRARYPKGSTITITAEYAREVLFPKIK